MQTGDEVLARPNAHMRTARRQHPRMRSKLINIHAAASGQRSGQGSVRDGGFRTAEGWSFRFIDIALMRQVLKLLRIVSHTSLPEGGSQLRTLALSGRARFPVASAQLCTDRCGTRNQCFGVIFVTLGARSGRLAR